MRPVRTSAKALIRRGDALLVIVKRDDQGEWCLLPGGGQEPGEALGDTLQRECREELGTGVQVGDLVCVRDYIGRNHAFAATDGEVHQLELLFDCQVPADYDPRSGPQPDDGQVAVRWVPLDRLAQARLYPAALIRWLARDDGRPRYLGDVN